MTDFAKIYNEAEAYATGAKRQHLLQYGEGMCNCGFAWVKIAGNTAFARWCRKNGVGSKGYPKGWSFWGPGRWPTTAEMGFTVYQQDMDVNAAGARAFAAVLRGYGIEAEVGSRLD